MIHSDTLIKALCPGAPHKFRKRYNLTKGQILSYDHVLDIALHSQRLRLLPKSMLMELGKYVASDTRLVSSIELARQRGHGSHAAVKQTIFRRMALLGLNPDDFRMDYSNRLMVPQCITYFRQVQKPNKSDATTTLGRPEAPQVRKSVTSHLATVRWF